MLRQAVVKSGRHPRAADEHPQPVQVGPGFVQVLQQRDPDAWNAGGEGDGFLSEEVDQADRVQKTVWKHEFGAEHRRPVRKTPRIRMEHWHDGEYAVRLGQADAAADRDPEGVQNRGTVAVADAVL